MADFDSKSGSLKLTLVKHVIVGLIAVIALFVVAATVNLSRLSIVAFFLVAAYGIGVISMRGTGSGQIRSSQSIQTKNPLNSTAKQPAEAVKKSPDDAERKKIRSLVKRNHELLVLYSLANVVSSSLEINEVLSVALDGVAKIFNAKAGEIGITGEPGATLVIYYRGSSILAKYRGETAPRLSRRLTTEVAKTGEPIIANLNREEDSKMNKMSKHRGIAKLAVFPIKSKKRILVTITLACPNRCKLDKTDQDLLVSIGSMIGAAIENGQLYRRLKKISDTDPVTGLYNHRFITKRLNAEVRRAARYGHSVSVLMLDVDNFKEINDTYGHPFGDVALKKIALATIAACRDIDVVGRYGGDEFLLVLPETKVEAAETVSARIRQYVQSISLIPDGSSKIVGVTASLGLAVYPGSAKNGTELIMAADKNLYFSKRAGGDQTTSRQAA